LKDEKAAKKKLPKSYSIIPDETVVNEYQQDFHLPEDGGVDLQAEMLA